MRNPYRKEDIEAAIADYVAEERSRLEAGVAVYLVVMDRGGVFGAYLDFDRAREAASNIRGVLVILPIIEDYR